VILPTPIGFCIQPLICPKQAWKIKNLLVLSYWFLQKLVNLGLIEENRCINNVVGEKTPLKQCMGIGKAIVSLYLASG
jgi:hypothetical protein